MPLSPIICTFILKTAPQHIFSCFLRSVLLNHCYESIALLFEIKITQMQKSKQLILLGATKPSVEAQYLTIGGGKEMPVQNRTEKDLYNIILNDLYNFRLFWKTSDIFSSKVIFTKLGFDSGSELWWSNPWGAGLFCTNGNTGTPHQTQIQIQCNTIQNTKNTTKIQMQANLVFWTKYTQLQRKEREKRKRNIWTI